MNKNVKKIMSLLLSLSMVIAILSTPVSAMNTYDQQVDILSNNVGEGTIVIDLTQGEKVIIDPSNFEVINTNTRAINLPYSGGIAFSTNVEVYSPIFITNFDTGNSQLKFAPSNFDGSKKIDITLYTHSIYDGANVYTAHELGKLTFNSLISYRILFSGTAVTGIDKVYLGFTPHSDCATSFDYTLSIT